MVSHTCRYAPKINDTYAEMAAHYGTAVLPARPYKPRDKAKAEVAVQIVERWVRRKKAKASLWPAERPGHGRPGQVPSA